MRVEGSRVQSRNRNRLRQVIAAVLLTVAGMTAGAIAPTAAAADDLLPVGYFDTVSWAGAGQARVTGWAFTGSNTYTPVAGFVAVYVDNLGYVLGGDQPRPDVRAAFGLTDDRYGFDGLVPFPTGTHRFCAYALEREGPGHTLLGCKTMTASGDPLGVVDSVALNYGPGTGMFTATITGWSFDPDKPDGPGGVAVYVRSFGVPPSEAVGFQTVTNLPRPDVQAAYHLSTDAVGFQVTVGGKYCTSYVRLYALNQAGSGTNPLFFSRTDISTNSTVPSFLCP